MEKFRNVKCATYGRKLKLIVIRVESEWDAWYRIVSYRMCVTGSSHIVGFLA